MKYSIKNKIINNFLLILITIMLALNCIIFIMISKYYYNSSEQLLSNQLQTSVAFYNKYFSSSSLEENVNDNVDSFWNQVDAQVQIYDKNGSLLMDSIGVESKGEMPLDVKKAINGGKTASWIGKVDYSKDKLMAVTRPIIVNNKTIGALRYIVSLEKIDKQVKSIGLVFVLISLVAVLVGAVMCIFIGKSIVTPINELTNVAEKMAGGDLKVRNNMNDKSEIGQLANTLDYMAEELLKKDKLKDEFISSVSHELRTPLTAIKGWVITIDNDKTDKQTLKKGLKVIEKETDRLVSMVEELLDFSRLTNGKVSIHKEEVEICNLVEYINIYMGQRAKNENKNFLIKTNMFNETVYLDKDKIKQVLINLLDNAFKFTNEGGSITLEISKDSLYNKFIVKDTGCGISKEELPRVKEKFYKGKNAKSQNGIGLSICEEIVKLHKGTMVINSEENVGTEIIVSLPKK